jgi:hypothetical protein
LKKSIAMARPLQKYGHLDKIGDLPLKKGKRKKQLQQKVVSTISNAHISIDRKQISQPERRQRQPRGSVNCPSLLRKYRSEMAPDPIN